MAQAARLTKEVELVQLDTSDTEQEEVLVLNLTPEDPKLTVGLAVQVPIASPNLKQGNFSG